MALNLDDKKALVAEVGAVAATAKSVVAAEYRGLTVSQMTELRSRARSAGVYLRVIKNTLARKAMAGTAFECMNPALKGPLVLAFSREDPGAAARVVKAFAKDHDKLVATALALGRQLLAASALERVANLPTREQALAQLMGVMRAPMQKLAATLQATPSKLVRTMAAVRDRKQAA
jgi:large subunit ribosomal protein L10